MIDSARVQLGISGWDAISTIVAVAVLYTAFTVLLGMFGQRLGARLSSANAAFLIVVGAVAARCMLGAGPSMATGLLAILELLALQGITYRLQLRFGLHPVTAKVVMTDGVVDEAMLAAARFRSEELWTRLRRAGITQRSQVAYAIIETDGTLTVIRAGTPLDVELVDGVEGLSLPR
ncbi:MAG: DUF421 domain-containing protein [Propionibacteriaceae bacterium]|nr:DUF421 domain-containing protein [Propionibacteriaceae bacterium]